MLENKFQMSVKSNVFSAKRNVADSVWKESNLLGIQITYPDAYMICEGLSVDGITVDELNRVSDLKNAWYYIADNAEKEVTPDFICDLDKILCKHTSEIQGSQTDLYPELPETQTIQQEITELLNSEASSTEKAINVFLYLSGHKAFQKCNDGLPWLVANKILIANGNGIFNVPLPMQSEFLSLLSACIESGKDETIKQFIFKNCLMR